MEHSTDQHEAVVSHDFVAFYRDHWHPLYRAVAVFLSDHQLAREAVDEAMARAYERWGEVGTYANPAGWVFRVATNWARSRLRRRWREVIGAVDEPTWEPPDPDPTLRRAVAALPPRLRAVVVLRLVLDWSVADTALALGIAEGTVKSRLSRALEELRSSLS